MSGSKISCGLVIFLLLGNEYIVELLTVVFMTRAACFNFSYHFENELNFSLISKKNFEYLFYKIVYPNNTMNSPF